MRVDQSQQRRIHSPLQFVRHAVIQSGDDSVLPLGGVRRFLQPVVLVINFKVKLSFCCSISIVGVERNL